MNQEIPDGWNKVKFKELAKQKSVRIDNPGESGFEKYVGLEHLDSGELVVKRYGSTSDVTSTMKLFNKGDILFARRNTYLKRVSVAPFDGVCSGDIIVLEPILDHIVEGFLPIFMQFEPFENKIIALSAGAFSKRIKWKQLAEEEIVIPSIEEQKKIVEILWSIEENAEKNENLINATEVLKKGLQNKLLTKGIGHTKFKDSELGEIPEEWDVIELADILKEPIKNGINKNKEDFGFGTKFVNVIDNFCFDTIDTNKLGRINVSDKEIGTYCLEKGDITVVRSSVKSSGVAYPALFEGDNEPVIFCGFVIRIRVNCDKMLPKYLLYYLRLEQTRNIIVSRAGKSALTNINQKTLNGLEIILPHSLNEQLDICHYLENVDKSVNILEIQLNNLKDIKKKLTNNFISGKLIIPKEVL